MRAPYPALFALARLCTVSSIATLAAACQVPSIYNTNTTEVTIESDCCDSCCCEDDDGGGGCGGTDDGGDDTGCDDTGGGSDCLDFVAPEPLDVVLDEACEAEADPIDFAPEVEWEWNPTDRTHTQVMMTPVVGPLTDDNGDGRVDASDPTDVAFTAFQTNYDGAGAFVILDGSTGTEHLYLESLIYDSKTYKPFGRGGVALGDLDADGTPEACFVATPAALACVHADGTPLFVAAIGTELSGTQVPTAYPVIGDMDGDGQAEIAVGPYIWDSAGSLVGTGDYGAASYTITSSWFSGSAPAMADMDGDGDQELVVGNAVYQRDGSALWSWEDEEDGPVAIGDFDGDGLPDVVTVGAGTAYVRMFDGTAFPGAGGTFTLGSCTSGRTCGAPTVADFDGDGEPEVGVAQEDNYTVYDYDRTAMSWSTLWSVATDDPSNATGSSVFDFEADGTAEVIYADEKTFFVLDGPTGATRLGSAGFDPDDYASATGFEYASVADVDGDDSTELVVASNDIFETAGSGGWVGVRAIGSGSGDAWAPSRPVWNQYAYSITNIDDDLSVPASPTDNWLTYNNFRAQDEGERPGSWQSDVFVQETSDYCVDCDNGEVTFYVAVANQGLAESGDFELVFDDGTVLHQETVADLASGETRVIGPIVIPLSSWTGSLEVWLDQVDDECDTSNNVWVVGEPPC